MKVFNMTGYINSIESLGLLDGPGIRYVVFMQGCPLRCLYCHNPETWKIRANCQEYTPKDLATQILKYKPYFKNNGGVTFSGGEPLMQQDFLIETAKLLKKEKIHIALDTAGSIKIKKELLDLIDLIILDIKSPIKSEFEYITKYSNNNLLEFIKDTQDKKKWIRHVIIPTINDTNNNIIELAKFIISIRNIENIELLGYHSMAIKKYEMLNIDYPIKHINDMDKNKLNDLEILLKDELNRKSTS